MNNDKNGDLDATPRIKIMDFGLSCVLNNQENSKNLTKCENYHVQTRYYRSPEVMLGIPYDQSSDMWQLGVIAAEMFRGKRFIISESDADHLAATMEIIGLPPLSVLESSSKRQIYYGRLGWIPRKIVISRRNFEWFIEPFSYNSIFSAYYFDKKIIKKMFEKP